MVKQARTTGSFKIIDNLTDEQGELIEHRKRNNELEIKVSSGDYGTKRRIITSNKEKYNISSMCRWLIIPRSSYYYKAVEPVSEAELEEKFKANFLQIFDFILKYR